MAKAKTATKKSSAVKSKSPQMRSLKLSREELPFFHFHPTQQSIYWIILCFLVLGLGIWVLTLTVKLQSLYDEVEINSSQTTTTNK